MNSLNTLYFPGTEIFSIRQYPIFLLFQKINLIKPVEEDPAHPGEESSDSFIKSGFCQVHTPCPLDENRKKFLALVEDIRNRKDDYAAQLSSLILASKSGSAGGDEESERSIINSLFTPKELQVKSQVAAKEEKLWQARLILAIGEILDQEEEEIARNLAVFEDDQAGLFKELHGDLEEVEEDNPFAELCQLESNLNAVNTGNIKKRFNGWKTLFLESDMQQCELFLTTNQDAGELLLEAYEKATNLPAPLVANLELPGLIGWNSAEAFQAVETFAKENGDLLKQIQELLASFSQQEDSVGQDKKQSSANMNIAAIAATTEEWQKQIETSFPAKQYGRIQVKCYLFPGIACATLTGKTQAEITLPKNGILVVVD